VTHWPAVNKPSQQGRRRAFLLGVLVFGAVRGVALADVLVGTNGERFVGTVVQESADTVVFDSELGGRIVVPRSKVRDIEHAEPKTPVVETNAPIAASHPVAKKTLNLDWRPPAVGKDGSDWIQLKSGEWLRGKLKYVQQKRVEFDSDELEELDLKLKDVRQVYSAQPVFTKFHDSQSFYGTVVISNDEVRISGATIPNYTRDELTGVTPGGEQEIKFWSAEASLGLNFQSGNTKQATLSASAEIARRTPDTRFMLNYLGDYSEVNDSESANNHRLNSSFDIWLTRRWFIRPVLAEAYHDPQANVSLRVTGGSGVGYEIFDEDSLEWAISAAPSYQYTRFETVEPGSSDSATTPAAVLQSNFKADITSRLTFIQNFQMVFTDREAGLYTHHAVTSLEFEIKRHLDLEVSFVWDFLDRPQPKSDGTIPFKNDYFLIVGTSVRF